MSKTLLYPLPHRRGFGETLTALLPNLLQTRVEDFSDRLVGERHQVEILRHTLELNLGEGGPDCVRAGLIGDIHYDPLCEGHFIERCVEMMNREDLDFVFLLGDFLSNDLGPVTELSGLLGKLRSRWGSYAVLGNHDFLVGEDKVARALEREGIRVLRNDLLHVDAGGGTLCLAGFESATFGRPDLPLLDGIGPEEQALVLCHEPDFFLHASEYPGTALQLSGHTHGGQIRLPGIRPALLPRLGKLFIHGLHQRNQSHIYVNRGLGTSHLHIRMGAPPEITILTLNNRRP